MLDSEKVSYIIIAKNRSVFADKLGTELTVAAQTNGTIHISFEG